MPPTTQDTRIGKFKPPIWPALADSIDSIASTAGSTIARITRYPERITAVIIQYRQRVMCLIRPQTKTAKTEVRTIITPPPKRPIPPACQPAVTGGMETRTPAKPPSAANPIIPKFTMPAYPHWIFAPNVIIAEIRHRFKMAKDRFQLCSCPTMTNKTVIMPNRTGMRFFSKNGCVDCENMATISSFRQTARLGGSKAQPEE